MIREEMKMESKFMQFLTKFVLAFLCIALGVSWGCVFFIKSTAGVVSWWFLQAFSIVGIVMFFITLINIIKKIFRHEKIHITIFIISILALISAWPFGWFLGIGQIAYPSNVNTVKPIAEVRLPINQSVLVGWGGDSIKTNYHVMAPNERWAYDLVIPPASIKSSRLEDYGIYGVQVISPVSGTIIDAYDGEEDVIPGTDKAKTMIGNYVYIRLDKTKTYIVMAHLKKGSLKVKKGEHVEEGTVMAEVGNSGNSSEPHLHIHHQRQDPSKTSMFLSEGLPLYFRSINGIIMPKGGIRVENGKDIPIGEIISPLK